MEVEVKFRVDDPAIFTALTNVDQVNSYTLRLAAESEHQRNIYYDTADGVLRAARYGLRIREVNGRSIATLKGPNQGHDGLHQRPEWELAAQSPDPSTWPPGAARDQALALLGDRSLLPLLSIETMRRHIYAHTGGRDIAEISLDEGTITAGARSESFCELEIELLPEGTPDDLHALVTNLQERYTLIPEPRSKLERGLALQDASTKSTSI